VQQKTQLAMFGWT